MPDFSVILQAPQIRALVQQNILERAFHDALFPRILFRGEATPQPWPAGVGDTMVFTAAGLMTVDASPLKPGDEPAVASFPQEQWTAQLQQYAGAIDTHMPTSMVAIANLFLRNCHQLGLMAALALDTKVRDQMYNAALSGWTVADGAQAATTTLRVKRLNGFTRARNPNLAGGSPVQYDFVSSTNPLLIHTFSGGNDVTRNVIGFTPDTPGDETGPGTLTLDAAVTVADRAYVFSVDRTEIFRVSGGNSIDTILSSSLPTLADIRAAVSYFWQQNVPEHPDGRFHAHLDPVSQAKIYQDNEFQRLLTALPDYYMYKKFAIGELLNTVFFRNSRAPVGGAGTVVGDGGSNATQVFDKRDPFAGELYNVNNVKVHRILFTAQGGIYEYYSDLSNLLTEAGLLGKVGDPHIVNNGIEVMSDRIQLIIRAPLNRLQDMVSTAWKFIGDWPLRTDGATGGVARYKRFAVIEHGE
jgi:hypothetical protein